MSAAAQAPHEAADARARALPGLRTRLLFDMVVDLEPRLDFGAGPAGRRVLFGSAGGTFAGDRLRGHVLPGGGDWAVFRPDGVMALDVRLSLRADDGALIKMTYGGRWVNPPEVRSEMADPARRVGVDPSRYYFRTTPLFETGSEQHAWLNDVVCVGYGYIVDGGVAYRVDQLL